MKKTDLAYTAGIIDGEGCIHIRRQWDKRMKALSLTQPMAWAIFHGKDVENRTWPTKFRGRVYIHASKKLDREHYQWIAENENRLACFLPQPEDLVHGAIIGEVGIIDCVQNHGSRWFTGPYAFVLFNPILYDKPIPCKGMLGFFEPDIERYDG